MLQILLSWLFLLVQSKEVYKHLQEACSKSIPEDKAGELFGFYNTFGRAGSVLGPL